MAVIGQVFTTFSMNGLMNQLKNQVEFVPYYNDDGTICALPQTATLAWDALWDTGAQRSVISDRVAAARGLQPISQTRVVTPSGEAIVPLHKVNILLPNQICVITEVAQCPLQGFDALIGMDVMNQGDLIVSNFQNRTTFTFRVPSMHGYDFTKNNYLTSVKSQEMPGRNEKCPCGSGKKYKECHGKK